MLANWIKETTTTTGTGTLTLTSVTDRPRLSDSFVVGELVQYAIETSDNKREAGIGTVAASNTLERTIVLSTYNGTTYDDITASALTLTAGTHNVFISQLSENVFNAGIPLDSSLVANANLTSQHINSVHGNTSISSVAQRNTAWPYLLTVSGILTGFSIYIAVAQTSATILLGLYAQASNGGPGRLIAKTSATIDGSTSGYKTQAIASNVRLKPGWYYVATLLTNSGSVPSATGGASSTPSMIGSDSNGVIFTIRHDSTVTDLADPFPTTNNVYGGGNGGNLPMIGLLLS